MGYAIDIVQSVGTYIDIAYRHDVGETVLRDAASRPLVHINPVSLIEHDIGSLAYFSIVSHSVSRVDLYKEVGDFLEKQVTCKARPVKPPKKTATEADTNGENP